MQSARLSSFSVVIPNYNGLSLLQQNIPPLMNAARTLSVPWEIIVVDDASDDDSVCFLRDNYAALVVLQHDKNRGFSEAMNTGIAAAKYDVIVALNTDVVVDLDFFDKALCAFDDPSVFSVTPNIMDPKTGKNQAIYKLRHTPCWFDFRHLQLSDIHSASDEIPLFFASGGSSFYDREKLMQIGAFDGIYSPFYVEDVDLSYRAWKAGWKCILEPSTTVVHNHQSTISKYHKRRKTKYIAGRNKVLCMWLNITDWQLILTYWLMFIPMLFLDLLSFRKYVIVGYLLAIPKIGLVIDGRRRRKQYFVVRDRNVIRSIS